MKPSPRATATCFAASSTKNDTALVRARAVALGMREELVGHDDPRDDPAAECPCRGTGEQEHVGDRVEVEAVVAHPAQELVVLPRVPAGLVDDEARTGLRLLAELLVLRDHLALVLLWFVTTQPRKKSVSRRDAFPAGARPAVHRSSRRRGSASRPSRCRRRARRGRGAPSPGSRPRARGRCGSPARRAASRGSRARCDSSPCRRGG